MARKRKPVRKAERKGTRPAVSRGAPETTRAAARDKSRDLLAVLFLVIATACAYWDVQDHPFILYDDGPYVYENAAVRRGLTLEGVQWAFASGHESNWHPLTWLSHMLDCQLFGVEAAGSHHRTAMILHILNSALTFLVFSRLTRTFWRSLVVASFFALHPLHVESVAWVAERKDVLSQFFWLLSIGSYVAYVRRHDWRWYGLSAVFLACGLMSKPMLVTAPFLFLLLDYWPLQRVATLTGRERASAAADDAGDRVPQRGAWQLLVEKVPFFVMTVASSIVTYRVQSAGGSVVPFPLWHRAATVPTAYAGYLKKTFWPTELAIFYPNHVGMWSTSQVVAALLLLLAITAIVLRLHHKRYLTVGWLWFLGTLVPVIGFVGLGGQSMADRYMYMPMTGLLIMLVWGGAEFSRRISWGKAMAAGIAIVALFACVWLTVRQVELWSSSRKLYSHTVAVTRDNFVVHNNLGAALATTGETEKAISHYREAIRIRPSYGPAYINLGNALKDMGNLKEAVATYREVRRIDPNNTIVCKKLGSILLMQGRLQEAIDNLRQALLSTPNDPKVYHDLGLAIGMQGHLDKAIPVFREGLLRFPDDPWLHTSLGNVLRAQGHLEEAIAHHRQALQAAPDEAGAYNTLGVSLLMSGRAAEAIPLFQETLRRKSSHREASDNLQRAETMLNASGAPLYE